MINSEPDDYNAIERLNELSAHLNQSKEEADQTCSSYLGRVYTLYSNIKGQLPEWAEKYISVYKQFKNEINEDRERGLEIPQKVIKILKDNEKFLQKICKFVDYSAFLKAIQPETKSVDTHRLLTSKRVQRLKQLEQEWHLNLGLLISAYEHTNDPILKQKIGFLALNYLAKAAPATLKVEILLLKEMESFDSLFQLGLYQEREEMYHRETSFYENILMERFDQLFSQQSRGRFYILDTQKVDNLYPLYFTALSSDATQEVKQHTDKWATKLQEVTQNHIQAQLGMSLDPFDAHIDPPLLVDISEIIKDYIVTEGDPKKETSYMDRQREIEKALENAIEKAIDGIKAKHPTFIKNKQDEEKLRVFLFANLNIVSRHDLKGVTVLKVLPFFMQNLDPYRLPENVTRMLGEDQADQETLARNLLESKSFKIHSTFVDFINLTGIRIGGVRAREKILEFMSLPEAIRNLFSKYQITRYIPKGSLGVRYSTPEDIINTNLFKSFYSLVTKGGALYSKHPQAALIGRGTIKLIEGLMHDINPKTWEKLNQDPHSRSVLQTSLFRLSQHLSNAKLKRHDFNAFDNAIEAAHYEIAAILALTMPYEESDYPEAIERHIETMVPQSLRAYTQVGMSRSAMNTFGGINLAVLKMNPKMERVYGSGSYYEEVGFIGEGRTTEEVLNNDNLQAIDLYVGEFNHNISLDMRLTHYTQNNMIDEIERLLDAKGDTEHLTVAVDNTIDYANSENVKRLLEHFRKEIEEGKLNFVIFRSGQKWDMFGTDNYYGAPFFIVNNGASHWDSFKELTTSETYRTDNLSQQWFTLVAKYALEETDQYRKAVFENARTILNNVPEILKPREPGERQPPVRVNTSSDEMSTMFLDIKINSDKLELISGELEKHLYSIFAKSGKKIASRSSFGFTHANITTIRDPVTKSPNTIRITPGINPEDNKIIIQFLKDIPDIVMRIEAENVS